MEISEILLLSFRTLLGFVILVISMKIMGKREIGELSIFDFIIILSIADVMIIGIENYKDSIILFFLPLVILVILQKLISIIDLKFPSIRNLIDGKEQIIIYKGKLIVENMKKEKYNMNDLYTQLRSKDIRTIEEVEYAILETNGNLSVFTYEENNNSFPLPIIISGKINEKYLKYTKFDKEWVYKELKRQNINTTKNILGASLINDKLIIIKKSRNE